jgi:hypothetical protein
MYENRTLIMFGPVKLTVLHEELHNLYSSPNIAMMIMLRIRWALWNYLTHDPHCTYLIPQNLQLILTSQPLPVFQALVRHVKEVNITK